MTTTTYDRRPGWLTFAAVVMFAIGFVRIISAINYFRGGYQIADLTNSAFGEHLWVWGIWDLCLAALAFVAGASVLQGHRLGRILTYVWAIWVIVQSFLIIAWAPWFGVSMMAMAALVIYGVASSEWLR